MTLLWAVLGGVAVGLVLGALGGGGAIITVPILIYALGMPPDEGTTGSLVIVGTSSVVAALSHHRQANVAWGPGVIFAALGTGGTVLGALLARGLEPDWLMVGFGILLIVVATLMLRGTSRHRERPDSPAERHRLVEPRTLVLTVLTATGVGLLTGFFGVGGGFAIVPALALVLGFPMPLAVGTSLLVIAVNSATALMARLAVGVELDWPVVLAFAATAMAASTAGTRVSTALPPAALQKAFALLLLAVSAYTLAVGAHALAG